MKRGSQRPKAAPKGKYGRVYFSPEFLALAKKAQVKPDWFAGALIHTYTLEYNGAPFVFVSENGPMPDEAFDLDT